MERNISFAIENDDVTSDGTPFITVIVDGGWSHQSHGHRYDANSGVSCVTDGNSSVHKRLNKMVPYGLNIEKIECANHVIKNYTKALFKIQGIPASIQSASTRPIIKRFTHAEHEKNLLSLREDLRNEPFHVFGVHENCKSYFCFANDGSLNGHEKGGKKNPTKWLNQTKKTVSTRKCLFGTNKLKDRKKIDVRGQEDYGEFCQELDMNSEELEKRANDLMKSLQVTINKKK
ncbi:hypothetical protein ILUMI_26793 [Ignelater luminosus]|uniref:Mutator-like transposase domain-containing protein n=1 Tax=Ignelater luminosus TaxID=2038154 RepID=A0A8K0C3H5_IGNLU|nr:hypothetical protein ILUMI_26793 [Ignelater luminosus]